MQYIHQLECNSSCERGFWVSGGWSSTHSAGSLMLFNPFSPGPSALGPLTRPVWCVGFCGSPGRNCDGLGVKHILLSQRESVVCVPPPAAHGLVLGIEEQSFVMLV